MRFVRHSCRFMSSRLGVRSALHEWIFQLRRQVAPLPVNSKVIFSQIFNLQVHVPSFFLQQWTIYLHLCYTYSINHKCSHFKTDWDVI